MREKPQRLSGGGWVISIHDILAPRGQRRYRLGIRYTTDLNNAEWNLIADDFLKPTVTGWPRQPPVAPGAGSLNIKGSGACGPRDDERKTHVAGAFVDRALGRPCSIAGARAEFSNSF